MAMVVARLLKGTQVQVIIGEHSFIIDEPQVRGGDNLGPPPIGTLVAALGA